MSVRAGNTKESAKVGEQQAVNEIDNSVKQETPSNVEAAAETTSQQNIPSDNPNEKLSITDMQDFNDLRVLMRVDYNCPMGDDGKVSDDTRIRETLPTLKLIKDKGAKCIVLISHLGRPKGREEKLTLFPVAQCLSKLMNEQITFIDDTVGSCVEKAVNAASGGRLILLENVRFYEQEENEEDPVPDNVVEFRENLTSLGDVFVNDAFGCAHRAHSSVVGIGLPTRAAGLLMKKEVDVFSNILINPQTPFLAILGGAKVHDKIKLIENLLEKVNVLIIGGAMAFTFLKVLYEMEIGQSLFDDEGVEDVKAIAEKADQKEVKINLPLDFVIANKMDPDAEVNTCTREDGIPKDWLGMDIGEKTIEAYKEVIQQANTIIWNGPMGVFEWEKFEIGTKSLLECVCERTSAGATTVLGGGDTASAAAKWNQSSNVTHVSTGGGATLELLEGKELPGVAALTNKIDFEKQPDNVQGAMKKASDQEEALDPDESAEPAAENNIRSSKTNEPIAAGSVSRKSQDPNASTRESGMRSSQQNEGSVRTSTRLSTSAKNSTGKSEKSDGSTVKARDNSEIKEESDVPNGSVDGRTQSADKSRMSTTPGKSLKVDENAPSNSVNSGPDNKASLSTDKQKTDQRPSSLPKPSTLPKPSSLSPGKDDTANRKSSQQTKKI